ncbi:hypothetical protein E2C06_35710 [Dankookia rubra]|uniref:Uncharacterized protein n=1 Tax=Dankookia rubra TaxID=1442381 RepID=A0A4R5Q532_9PROT|nr:hypothetical protein E2C06_35710 [Dankookia rubra]
MATTSKWLSASRRRAAALPLRPVPLAATPPTGKIVQAVVERTIAWLNRCRRLAKDWKRLNRRALTFLRRAAVCRMLRRLCQ